MARLVDPEILSRYIQASTDWKTTGSIELIGGAHEGLRTTLEGVSVPRLKELLFRFVRHENGEIDQVKE